MKCRTKILTLAAEGEPVTLAVCRPGFFLYHEPGMPAPEMCLKARAPGPGQIMQTFCSTGGRFWGGTMSARDRSALIVQPIKLVVEGA